MSKFWIILLIPLLFLSSCTIDWNSEKDKKIKELEKQIIELKEKNNDTSFKRKKDCHELYEKILGPSLREISPKASINIFYSEQTSSCLTMFDWWTDNERNFVIYDILAQKQLFSFVVDKDWKIKRKNHLVESDLDKLKCEFNDALSELWGDKYFSTECSYIK